jgi:hypothetical protein
MFLLEYQGNYIDDSLGTATGRIPRPHPAIDLSAAALAVVAFCVFGGTFGPTNMYRFGGVWPLGTCLVKSLTCQFAGGDDLSRILVMRGPIIIGKVAHTQTPNDAPPQYEFPNVRILDTPAELKAAANSAAYVYASWSLVWKSITKSIDSAIPEFSAINAISSFFASADTWRRAVAFSSADARSRASVSFTFVRWVSSLWHMCEITLAATSPATPIATSRSAYAGPHQPSHESLAEWLNAIANSPTTPKITRAAKHHSATTASSDSESMSSASALLMLLPKRQGGKSIAKGLAIGAIIGALAWALFFAVGFLLAK